MVKAGLEIRADIKALRKEFADARNEFRQFNEQAIKAATGVRQIEQAAKPAGSALGGFFKQFTAGTVAGNLITGVLSRAKQAIVSFATGSIQASSSLTELDSKARVVFGQTFERVQGQAKAVANEVGRASSAILQMATDFGAIIKAFGITGPLMDDMSVRLAKLAVDMASFHNTSDENAFMALRSGLSGETEPLKRFGIVLTDTNLKFFALEKGIKSNVEQMNQAQKTALRYEFILDKTKDSQGDAARTAESYANQTRRLSGEITTLQEEMGKSVTPALADALSVLSASIQTTRLFTRELIKDLGSLAEAISLKLYKAGVTKQSTLKGMKLGFMETGAKTQPGILSRVSDRLEAEKNAEGTAELNERINALDSFESLGGVAPSKGQGAAKAAEERDKAIRDVMQALSAQAQANAERLKQRREELKLRERLGVLTKEESRELETINRRVDFQEDKVRDLTQAWESANDRVKTMRKTVADLNADIIKQRQELNRTLAGIDEDANRKKAEKLVDLLREQKELEGKLVRREGLSLADQERMGEIDGLLKKAQVGDEGAIERRRMLQGEKRQLEAFGAQNQLSIAQKDRAKQIEQELAALQGIDPFAEAFKKAQAFAGADEFKQIDMETEERKREAAIEHNRKLDETLGDLIQANQELAGAEAARAEALKLVTAAVEEMGEKQAVQFQGVEEATRVHVAAQITELGKLEGAIKDVEAAYINAAAAASNLAAMSSGLSGPAQQFAIGGTVHGRQGIDKVPAWLTSGEEVINKVAAQRYRPLLKAINSFSLPAPRFAQGGTVQTYDQRRSVQVHQTFNHAAMSNPEMHRWLARFAHQ
jgi:hypothetical protein